MYITNLCLPFFHLSVHVLVAAWQVSHGAVLYEGNKTMPLFLLSRSKGSWLSRGGSLLASEANNLASSTPNMRYWESTQTLHQQYHFLRPILHKHTFYIKDPLSHPLFVPTTFQALQSPFVSVAPAISPRLNTREVQRLQHTPCSL